ILLQNMTNDLAILGSTGSIGTQVLDVARRMPDRFRVVSLSAGRNDERLAAQIREFSPARVAIQYPEDADTLRKLMPDYRGQVFTGADGLSNLAGVAAVDTAIVGLVGM